ncbi:hypothetical protein [Kribbella albertanoniae]|uniref:Uncharacterized protein n=1 Tax=Kribbella albertanoniae TaxID=1266829 RepID=A0A4R4P2T7_9ACTN|nr:hypothetical protein [Kribbella albertanoniae]TDC16618.1 hypothetical protein E1261_38675 [Kribbella albertanoniae]
MPYVPSVSQSFQVTVPTRGAAEELAGALAVRGHRLVAIREVDHFSKDASSFWYGKPSMRPDEQGQWDVFSVATGPVPDADEDWWRAQEDEAVRRLAERLHGRTGGSGGGGGTDLLLRTFAREGLVYDLDETTVYERRLLALGDSPGRAGAQEERSVDEALPDGPGDAVVLSGIDSVGWGDLTHAYGPASDVPELIRGLAANDDNWDDLHTEFVGSVLHQGSTYSSSAPALQLLAQLAMAPQLAPKRRLDLLYTLFIAACEAAKAEAYGYRPDAHDVQVRAVVTDAAEGLVRLWPSVSRAEQRMLLLLAALSRLRVPEHHLSDPASRLAAAMIRDVDEAEAALIDLASRSEDLIELANGHAPTRSRLTAALETLLWEP